MQAWLANVCKSFFEPEVRKLLRAWGAKASSGLRCKTHLRCELFLVKLTLPSINKNYISHWILSIVLLFFTYFFFQKFSYFYLNFLNFFSIFQNLFPFFHNTFPNFIRKISYFLHFFFSEPGSKCFFGLEFEFEVREGAYIGLRDLNTKTTLFWLLDAQTTSFWSGSFLIWKQNPSKWCILRGAFMKKITDPVEMMSFYGVFKKNKRPSQNDVILSEVF